jgi:hypothetical protein
LQSLTFPLFPLAFLFLPLKLGFALPFQFFLMLALPPGGQPLCAFTFLLLFFEGQPLPLRCPLPFALLLLGPLLRRQRDRPSALRTSRCESRNGVAAVGTGKQIRVFGRNVGQVTRQLSLPHGCPVR